MTLLEQTRKQLRSEVEVGRDYFEQPKTYEDEIRSGVKWEVLKYGHLLIDEHCPYKQGQLTTIIGHTNVGKTYLILYLLSKLVAKGKKTIIYSAENRISQIARIILRFHFQVQQFTESHFQWLRERVLFIRHAKQFSYRDLLEQISIADDIEFNADIAFIDPYNSLKIETKGNTHEYHMEAMEDLRIFTMRTKKSIFLNCHTVTDAQRVKANQDGEISIPIMGDVEGGAKFPNKSDDVWVIHRNLWHRIEEERYISLLHIGKVRNTEGGGKPTPWSDPIRFKFKRDWTGFTQDKDEVEMFRPRNFDEPEWIK